MLGFEKSMLWKTIGFENLRFRKSFQKCEVFKKLRFEKSSLWKMLGFEEY